MPAPAVLTSGLLLEENATAANGLGISKLGSGKLDKSTWRRQVPLAAGLLQLQRIVLVAN